MMDYGHPGVALIAGAALLTCGYYLGKDARYRKLEKEIWFKTKVSIMF